MVWLFRTALKANSGVPCGGGQAHEPRPVIVHRAIQKSRVPDEEACERDNVQEDDDRFEIERGSRPREISCLDARARRARGRGMRQRASAAGVACSSRSAARGLVLAARAGTARGDTPCRSSWKTMGIRRSNTHAARPVPRPYTIARCRCSRPRSRTSASRRATGRSAADDHDGDVATELNEPLERICCRMHRAASTG